MQYLHEVLEKQANRVSTTAIVGMGGIGKTELALQYVRRYWKTTYPDGVCWLEGRDQDIFSQILTFAATVLNLNPPDELPLKAQIAYCWRYWPSFSSEKMPKPVLIVIDDVLHYEAIFPFLPKDERFSILLTSRNQNLATTVTPVQVEVLEQMAALDLLKQLTGKSRIERELDQANKLCHCLGYLPLALELVGRYLFRRSALSIEDLMCRLEKPISDVRALARVEPGMTNAHSIINAFELSWSELSLHARSLAKLLSCFAFAPIPGEIVQTCLPYLVLEDLEDLEDLLNEQLEGLSFIKRIETNRYQFHQLIQRFIRAKFVEDDLDDLHIKSSYCRMLIPVSKDIDEHPTRQKCLEWSEMTPHVEELVNEYISHLADKDILQFFISLVHFYSGQGAYKQAQYWSRKCCDVVSERLGKDHLDAAFSLNKLAEMHHALDQYDTAEELFQKSISTYMKLVGEEHPDTANSINNLALVYHDKELYLKAEEKFKESLEIRRKVLDENHPDIADSLNNLGVLYLDYPDSERYSEAESLFLEVLRIREKFPEKALSKKVTNMNNLAECYKLQERYAEAENLYAQALRLAREVLSDNHPDIATCLNNLGVLCLDQNRFKQAEDLLREAIELQKKVLGEKHSEVVNSIGNLAASLEAQGNYKEAKILHQEFIEKTKEIHGETHHSVGIAYNNLAKVYHSQKDESEAFSLYQKSLENLELSLGKEHPIYIKVQSNFRDLKKDMGI
ncbi:tetratricopeptide repeat protein [Leptothoe sp. LEGE 181152]|nr:tetratricopeptide repeat protein [Leptothoe sp. LEGE 181152]